MEVDPADANLAAETGDRRCGNGAGLAVAVLTGATPRAILDRHADHVIPSVMAIEALLDAV